MKKKKLNQTSGCTAARQGYACQVVHSRGREGGREGLFTHPTTVKLFPCITRYLVGGMFDEGSDVMTAEVFPGKGSTIPESSLLMRTCISAGTPACFQCSPSNNRLHTNNKHTILGKDHYYHLLGKDHHYYKIGLGGRRGNIPTLSPLNLTS